MYWTTSNLWTLIQMLVLKIPSVRSALGLPDMAAMAAAQRGASAAPSPAAAVGKPVETFSYNPTKQRRGGGGGGLGQQQQQQQRRPPGDGGQPQ